MIHMENKDLHVAIVLSPICGPIFKSELSEVLLSYLFFIVGLIVSKIATTHNFLGLKINS